MPEGAEQLPMDAGAATNGEFKLGVLVVHGIGNQTEGQTLVQGGDAIADWVEQWGHRRAFPPTSKASGFIHTSIPPTET